MLQILCVRTAFLFTNILPLVLFANGQLKLRSPGGPLYGIPFKGNSLHNFIPATLTGTCEANKTFTISSVEDLSKHLFDLECIYAGSRIPSRIPQGSLFGKVLTVANSPIFSSLVETQWKGKHIQPQICNGLPSFVGWNALFGGPTLPFIPRIGRHNLTLAPAESDDGRDALIIEYGNDVMELCPELREEVLEKLGRGGVSRAKLWGNNFPITDVMRFVGKQEDGGNLYLLKTYLSDSYREDKMAVTMAFVAIVNYDEEAEPGAKFGMRTKQLAKPFNYMFPGLVDILLRVQPLDNLLFSPTPTRTQIRKGIKERRKSVGTFARDLPLSYRKMLRNGRDWMTQFRDVEAQKRSRNEETEFEKFTIIGKL